MRFSELFTYVITNERHSGQDSLFGFVFYIRMSLFNYVYSFLANFHKISYAIHVRIRVYTIREFEIQKYLSPRIYNRLSRRLSIKFVQPVIVKMINRYAD